MWDRLFVDRVKCVGLTKSDDALQTWCDQERR